MITGGLDPDELIVKKKKKNVIFIISVCLDVILHLIVQKFEIYVIHNLFNTFIILLESIGRRKIIRHFMNL